MAVTGTKIVKLGNRSPKQPIKNLPESVELPADATVEDLKIAVAKAARIGDFNQIGVFDPTTKKTIKDRKANLDDEQTVLVKDLGMQIAWKTVFIVEYSGPILIHPAVVALRPYLYKNATGDMSATQWITLYMFVGHFVKRVLETQFVHKFSANTMPWFNIFKNSAHYWLLSGVLCAYAVYSPNSLAATSEHPIVNWLGIALFLFGEINNALVHLYLATLRSAGGTERKIPVGYSFSLVTSPNYMFEILAWLGVIVVSRNWAVVLFIAVGAGQMSAWAKDKERRYRSEFGDRYKKKRFAMLPGIV